MTLGFGGGSQDPCISGFPIPAFLFTTYLPKEY